MLFATTAPPLNARSAISPPHLLYNGPSRVRFRLHPTNVDTTPTPDRTPAMSDTERRLLALLSERSFALGEFRLASGAMSNYYIDGKMSEVYSRSARLIGEVLYERTRD